MTEINKEELDRHITGNYGEDQITTGFCEICDKFLSEKEFSDSKCSKCDNAFCDLCYEKHFANCVCGVQ